jgi:hypothetical protein
VKIARAKQKTRRRNISLYLDEYLAYLSMMADKAYNSPFLVVALYEVAGSSSNENISTS